MSLRNGNYPRIQAGVLELTEAHRPHEMPELDGIPIQISYGSDGARVLYNGRVGRGPKGRYVHVYSGVRGISITYIDNERHNVLQLLPDGRMICGRGDGKAALFPKTPF